MGYERDRRFRCPCCGNNEIDPRVERIHREIEEEVGDHVPVSSGWRCKKHNAEVGGSPTSSHLKGLAWDVAINGSRMRYMVLKAALAKGIHRIGIGKGFIHLDIDRQKDPRVVWVY